MSTASGAAGEPPFEAAPRATGVTGRRDGSLDRCRGHRIWGGKVPIWGGKVPISHVYVQAAGASFGMPRCEDHDAPFPPSGAPTIGAAPDALAPAV